jgi:GNAT superfamily N-acetyltransferase
MSGVHPGSATESRDDVYRLRTPTAAAEWAAYHEIRRTVLFERRGKGDEYDASHPDELRPGNFPLLLLYRGEPVGTIRVDLTPDEAIFRRVAIREDVQRRGHGRQMLALAEVVVRSKGRTRIRSHVDAAAVDFYERCGFTREASRPEGETVVMTKSLGRRPDE